jgi:predicted GH43/DUF377 family glycosyl hydrolase
MKYRLDSREVPDRPYGSRPWSAFVLLLAFTMIAIASGTTPQSIQFLRLSANPYVARKPGTFHSRLVANPAVADYKGRTYFIFRGQGEAEHDQIGLWSTPSAAAGGLEWSTRLPVPVIPVSDHPNAPDNKHVLDPAVIAVGETLFVYYTARAIAGDPDYSICLATSTDGISFTKAATNPLIAGVIAPEVVHHDGRFHLFYQRRHRDDYWELFMATSGDGITFDVANERRVFGPSRRPGAFDSHSIATARLVREGEYWYMTYAAATRYLDYPESIGLARSRDLVHWERYPGNPIFERGSAGTWDEAALWYPTVRRLGGRYLMWYEGAGTSLGLATDAARSASRTARECNYGGYLETSFSQIGVAEFRGDLSSGW